MIRLSFHHAALRLNLLPTAPSFSVHLPPPARRAELSLFSDELAVTLWLMPKLVPGVRVPARVASTADRVTRPEMMVLTIILRFFVG
jgi:hypothetical protein